MQEADFKIYLYQSFDEDVISKWSSSPIGWASTSEVFFDCSPEDLQKYLFILLSSDMNNLFNFEKFWFSTSLEIRSRQFHLFSLNQKVCVALLLARKRDFDWLEVFNFFTEPKVKAFLKSLEDSHCAIELIVSYLHIFVLLEKQDRDIFYFLIGTLIVKENTNLSFAEGADDVVEPLVKKYKALYESGKGWL